MKDLRERATDIYIAYKSMPATYNFLYECGMGLGRTKHDLDGKGP